MKGKLVAVVLAAVMVMSVATGQPASAQGGGCKEFGKNIALLATSYGVGFGQMAASTAPLNDTVEFEQNGECDEAAD